MSPARLAPSSPSEPLPSALGGGVGGGGGCPGNHAAQLAIVMQRSRQESRSSAGPDHVTLQALITWLIKSRSRD